MVSNIPVSVVVITYNSAKYVVETLESIKDQTYKNIELIVSDDASTDNTLTLVYNWVDTNEERFIKHKVVDNETNTGIAQNCNRGMTVATGDYIKLIAGDDLLLNNCIEDLLEFSLKNNLKIALSKAIPFYDSICPVNKNNMIIQELLLHNFFNKNQKQQYKELLRKFSIGYSLIGSFINREFFLSLGGYSEKYKIMEDYPFFLKVSSLGNRLCLLNDYTVKYRMRDPEKRSDFKKTKRYKLWFADLRMFEEDELLPRMKKEKMFWTIYDLHIRRLAMKIYSESNRSSVVFISRIIRYLSPLTIKDKMIITMYKLKSFFK